MEDFRNKLVLELEDFNKNVDETLKKAGQIRLERESEFAGRQTDNVIDLEKDLPDNADVFTQSYTKFDFKNKQPGTDRQAIPDLEISQDDFKVDHDGKKLEN